EVDGQVGGRETHLAVEIRRKREGDGGVGQRREDAPVDGPRAVGDLLPVREPQNRGIQGNLLEARPQPPQGRGRRQPPPKPFEQVRGDFPGSPRRRRAHKTGHFTRKTGGGPDWAAGKARAKEAPPRRGSSKGAPRRGGSSCRGAWGPRSGSGSRWGRRGRSRTRRRRCSCPDASRTSRSSGTCRSCRT